jgi:hypothetical protein
VSRLPASRLIQSIKETCTLPVRIRRRERLCVYLGDAELAVCRVAGRFRPVVQTKTILSCDASGRDIAAALAALDTWVRANSFRGAIEWIIGIDHVRYLVLPWDERLSSRSFCDTLAAASFAHQFFGNDVPFSAYQLRYASHRFGQPRLVALIPNKVVSTLATFAARHRCYTRCITPSLGAVWDRFFAHVKKDKGVLALVEGQRLLRVAYDHGHVTSLSVQPFSEEKTPAIPGDITKVFPVRNIAMPERTEWIPRGWSPDDDARFAYALCRVS